jgi:hypothetical protein
VRPEARVELRADQRPELRADPRGEAPAQDVASVEAAPQPAAQRDRVALGDKGLKPDTHGPAIVMRERRRDPQPRPTATGPAVAAAAPGSATAGLPVDSSRDGQGRGDAELARPTCTVAQLRRFIKSRPWIPLHELRRRFGISGGDDDVSPMRVGDHQLFIGLPLPESRLVAELLAGGDVGYELSLDPGAPIVVGVYPMRPVPRG